jgi:NADH-quinone oxidoreductase subunit C
MPDSIRAAMAERFPELVPGEGDIDPDGVLVPAAQHVEFASALKDLGFTLYVTVVASHWVPDAKATYEEHFQVATVLRKPDKGGSPEVWWRVELAPDAQIPTLYELYAGADWQEREQFDLVGVRFSGHPDMRRLMLPDDWEGHPLRKEYAIDTPHPPWR